MTRKTFRRFVGAGLLAFGFMAVTSFVNKASAQNFMVATGAEKGSTYTQMFNELKAACPVPPLQAIVTNGSIQNIELLTSNKANGAFVQSDLLFFTKSTNAAKVANIKTLVGLHPEELHFIARSDSYKSGGYGLGKFKIGGTTVSYNTLNDLAGKAVGAVGGSVLSGRVVAQTSGLNFNVVEYPNNDALKTALLEGQVDSILVVGGAPHALVASLDTNYKLLPVPPDAATRLKDIYSPAVLSYSNLNANGVQTISTQALFVTRIYNSQTMLSNLAALRACFNSKLGDIKDSLGTHAKWQDVQAGNTGKWPLYDLPTK